MMVEQCLRCRWARPISGGCEAFPDGIPEDMAQGVEAHDEVAEGQQGKYVFEVGEPVEMDFMRFAAIRDARNSSAKERTKDAKHNGGSE